MNEIKHLPRANVLRLQDLSLQVRLGCSVEERNTPQEIRISLESRFHKTLAGAKTDTVTEVVCYAGLSALLKEHCESREFNLIERIALECFLITRNVIPENVGDIAIRIHKVKPPVEGLLGGASFSCGDFIL